MSNVFIYSYVTVMCLARCVRRVTALLPLRNKKDTFSAAALPCLVLLASAVCRCYVLSNAYAKFDNF